MKTLTLSSHESSELVQRAMTEAEARYPGFPVSQAAFLRGYVAFSSFRKGRSMMGYKREMKEGKEAALQSMQANPMGFYCAPNQATPDYVCYSDIRMFIAYGMMVCHCDLQDVKGYTPNASHYHELRGYFLDTVERALRVYPELERGKEVQEDLQGYGSMLYTADADREGVKDGKSPENEFDFTWHVERVDHEGNVCLSLDWAFVGNSNHHEYDSSAMWIAAEVMTGHKREWRKEIAKARQMNEWLGDRP